MPIHPVRGRCTLLVAIFVFLELAFGGCRKAVMMNKTLYCEHKVVNVDHTLEKGVDHKAVYLCDGFNMEWKAAGDVASFEVEFKDPPFPFGPNATKFGTGAGE